MEHSDHHEQRGHLAYNKHAGHQTPDFLKKFWMSLVLTAPVFLYSDMAKEVFGIRGPEFAGLSAGLLFVGSILYFYSGSIFLRGAYREMKARLPGMMTLIALAITAAYAYSIWSLVAEVGHDLLFELGSLVTIMLLGHWVEMRSLAIAQNALKEFAKLLPDRAEVIRDGAIAAILVADLKVGDLVLVRPGSKIPADGRVVEGISEVNESILTGESMPVRKDVGAGVIAGSLNGDGSLKVSVTTIGEETFLAGVMRLIADAEASKSRLQALSDRAAFYLTIIAIIAAGLTFFLWLFAGAGVVTATERFVAVLVIACPHALGLAVPLVAAISTTMAAQNGLLVRRRLALEGARRIDTILFDKTGTLTTGDFTIESASSDEALALAASVEQYSEHPIGKAILAEARRRTLKVFEIRNFQNTPGVGAQAEVQGSTIFVGHRGGEDIVVEKDNQHVGTIMVADTIRPEATEAVSALKRAGISIAMITGDSEEAAKRVAEGLGITEYFARVRPEEKVQKVKLLQGYGKKVAMVGDGVNDAPALLQADLGVAVGAGANVAIESAGIILVRNDPRDIPKILNLSRLTYRKMIQNLFWATGYNIVAIPLAAGVLASRGIILEPWLAAVFMSVSTIIVAVNAAILRRQSILQ